MAYFAAPNRILTSKVPISVGIIIPTLCLAFSARIRNPFVSWLDWFGKLLHLFTTNVLAILFEYTGLHYLWKYYFAEFSLLRYIHDIWIYITEAWSAKGLREARMKKQREIDIRRNQQEYEILKRQKERNEEEEKRRVYRLTRPLREMKEMV